MIFADKNLASDERNARVEIPAFYSHTLLTAGKILSANIRKTNLTSSV